jgi:hypothetical protein
MTFALKISWIVVSSKKVRKLIYKVGLGVFILWLTETRKLIYKVGVDTHFGFGLQNPGLNQRV